MRRADSILGFITGTTVNIWFMHSVFNLFKADADQRFAADWLLVFGPYIHQNRNNLQKEFLATDREWFLMVDNDIVFTPEDVWELFREADENGPGIYAGPYLIEDGAIAAGPWDDEVPMVYHPLVSLPERPCPVGVVGAGFTLVHRDVFEAVGPDAFAPISLNAGEDISFSWRAREAGFVPTLVPAANPGHHKTVVLYPSQTVRNLIGEEVNLVQVDEEHKRLNEAMLELAGKAR